MQSKTQMQAVYWLKIVVIGVALGFGLQFVRAWTEPTTSPPGGNVGAPINTSTVDQTKGNTTSGKINAKDFCLNDGTKCLSTATATTPPTTPTCLCSTGPLGTGPAYACNSCAQYCDPAIYGNAWETCTARCDGGSWTMNVSCY